MLWYYSLSVKLFMWIVKQKIENKRIFFKYAVNALSDWILCVKNLPFLTFLSLFSSSCHHRQNYLSITEDQTSIEIRTLKHALETSSYTFIQNDLERERRSLIFPKWFKQRWRESGWQRSRKFAEKIHRTKNKSVKIDWVHFFVFWVYLLEAKTVGNRLRLIQPGPVSKQQKISPQFARQRQWRRIVAIVL